ncbi:hypothetical protein DUI87_18679 [Hirundo rustica rustica]|uniref:Uncharacterized protein n=1 Tax=Hirundo rustica rustica TaxID=333673 RepID=A0A3M0JWY4_HIRRU|nr:hypothetical protein DUI87_18679 [Hirundo rustica rustica]
MEGYSLVTGWVSEGSWRTVRLEVVGSDSGTVFGSAVVVLMTVIAGLSVESVPAELAAAAGFAAAVDAGAAADAGAAEVES